MFRTNNITLTLIKGALWVMAGMVLLISAVEARAEIIGDSIIAINNNWSVKEEATYQSYSSRTRIQGNDSILEAASSASSKIVLKDTFPNGDLIFETSTQMAPVEEIGELDPSDPLRKYYEKIYDLLERPQSFLTDSRGVVKDMYNYDLHKEELDSCMLLLHDWINTLNISEHQKELVMSSVNATSQQSLSKESMLENVGMFQYYGSEYRIGATSSKEKIPIPLFNNQEVEADVICTCSIIKKTDNAELISIRTAVVFDSEQLLNIIATNVLTHDQQRKSEMLDHKRSDITISQTEELIVDAISGTILRIEKEKKSILPDEGRIDYSITEITNFNRFQ